MTRPRKIHRPTRSNARIARRRPRQTKTAIQTVADAQAPILAMPASQSETPQTSNPSTMPSTPAANEPAATRDNISGSGTSLTQMLSNFPEILGHDEYDFREIKDSDELELSNNYEICREAIRQALLRMPKLYDQNAADTLAQVLREEPHLIVYPADHGDMHYFTLMSEAVAIWQACAPGTPLPPPIPSIIGKVREYRGGLRYEPAVGIELMDGPAHVKSEASQGNSRTFLIHVPIVGGKASLPDAMLQCRHAFMASGLFDNNGGGRVPSYVLSMAYYRLCQGNKHLKARLWFKDKLRKDSEKATKFGNLLYEAAIGGEDESPSEAAWSEGSTRIEELVMPLANRLMQLVALEHIKPSGNGAV